jgi:hypothetical protein
MPRYAPPPAWRQYRQNITRKGKLDADLVWESEVVPVQIKQPPMSPVSSPVSVQDIYLPEVQPLTLPGSWVVVGKNGKPVKGKMYEDPKAPKKKRKKKGRKEEVDHDPLSDLLEEPSSSQCLEMSHRLTAKHDKEIARGKGAKYWAKYREEKAVRQERHQESRAIFSVSEHARARAGRDGGLLARRVERMQEEMWVHADEQMRRKRNKGSSHGEKTRRANRFAAAAARCLMPNEGSDTLFVNDLASEGDSVNELKLDVNEAFWNVEVEAMPRKNRSPPASYAKHAKHKDKRKAERFESDLNNGSPKAKKKASKKKASCSLQ